MLTSPERWARPFGIEPLTDDEVNEALMVPILSELSADSFPPSETLVDILRHDARIHVFRKDDAVMLAGDYGHSVCFILEGEVTVVLDHSAPFRRHTGKRARVWRSLLQYWTNPEGKERRRAAASAPQTVNTRRRSDGNTQVVISEEDPWLRGKHTVTLSSGDMFGEIAALTRSPRSATVIAKEGVRLLEMRWQGFRDIRRFDKQFKKIIDRTYQHRSLKAKLAESTLFRHLDESVIEKIANATLYETYGRFEWHHNFNRQDNQTAIESEPILIEEGATLTGLIMVSNGFARLSVQQDYGHRTVGYLTQNELFGWHEIVAHWKNGTPLTAPSSVRALGYTDILLVPIDLLLSEVLPTLSPKQEAQIDLEVSKQSGRSGEQARFPNQALLDGVVDRRIINGTSTMFIDTERCVGCDDCVRACATNHGNNPRFIRQGNQIGRWSVVNACMHCVDPVCLIGCPTGAIQRSENQGEVEINESACIGCSSCANACPYDNIRMIDLYDIEGNVLLDEEGHPVRKASKCDLCIDHPGGPACERACPHEALYRIDMRDRDALDRLGRK